MEIWIAGLLLVMLLLGGGRWLQQRKRRNLDLGVVSDGWMAEHRSSAHESAR